MASQYFVVSGEGEKSGPFTVEALASKLQAGEVQAGTILTESETGAQTTVGAVAGPYAFAPNQAAPDRGRATVWIVIGAVGIVLMGCVGILAAILFPIFAQARLAGQQTTTTANLRSFGIAVLMYASDFDDVLPPTTESAEAMEPYVAGYYKDGPLVSNNPQGERIDGNAALGGKKLPQVTHPDRRALLFDSAAWPNGRRLVLFVTGRVERRPEEQFAAAKAAGFLFPAPEPAAD